MSNGSDITHPTATKVFWTVVWVIFAITGFWGLRQAYRTIILHQPAGPSVPAHPVVPSNYK